MKIDMRTQPGKGKHYQPYLDGEFLDNCFMADEEAGVALVYEHDAPNRRKRGADGKPVVKELHGKVELRRIEEAA